MIISCDQVENTLSFYCKSRVYLNNLYFETDCTHLETDWNICTCLEGVYHPPSPIYAPAVKERIAESNVYRPIVMFSISDCQEIDEFLQTQHRFPDHWTFSITFMRVYNYSLSMQISTRACIHWFNV